MREHTLITISRQYGSGGREIAEALAKKMGVRCYDRQILYLAAEQLGSGSEDIESILELSYRIPENKGGFVMEGLNAFGYDTIPSYNQMYREQAKIIRGIAKKEGAVFLGRCADVVLKEEPEHYSFFVCADEEFRIKRAKERYGNKSLKELDHENRTRERYYNYYTGQRWGDPLCHDLMLNTGRIPLDECADLIYDYVERRQSRTACGDDGSR